MEITSFIISILAFLLSGYQFLRESSRQKKEATLIAYNELQDSVFSKLNNYDDLSKIVYRSKEWEEITICLAKIENFSVGINTNIYSYKVLDRLGGAFFIRQFEKLEPIINEKREKNISPGKHYNEFEKTALRLKKHRSHCKEEYNSSSKN